MTLHSVKLRIRRLAIWLGTATELWVVPRGVHELINAREFARARQILDNQEQIWGCDPELTRTQTLISFLE